MAPNAKQRLGCRGEDEAARELVRRGYAILARRYRTRRGEIDIIARDGSTIVFVEVKTRMGSRFGDGASAVTHQKQRRMVVVAMDYLARHAWTALPCRFDVVVVTPGRDGDALRDAGASVHVEVLQHAFSVS